MTKFIHKLLYRMLPLEGYLRVVSRLFFLWQRLGIGRNSEAMEYVYHLEKLVHKGDHCLDIGANLGYYTLTLARLVGDEGWVHAVEPMAPMRRVLKRNLQKLHEQNVTIYPYALGEADREVVMANDSARKTGYLGTGQNFVKEADAECEVEYRAEMRRGSELFGNLDRLDFIKCDIEGYELHVMREMRPVLERYRPTVLIETGGKNRPQIIALFEELGYKGYTLHEGNEIPLGPESGKDIIFRNSQ